MMYVTMTDKFMGGWGEAKGKINKFVIECETAEQARKIKKAAENRKEMKYISVAYSEPHYNANKYIVSQSKFNELGTCWTR